MPEANAAKPARGTVLDGRLALLLTVAMAIGTAHGAKAEWVGEDREGIACSGASAGYGPYDYTNPSHFRNKLPIVQRHHFTPDVASLQMRPVSRLLKDIDYTLRAFPNHHRALFSVIQLFTREPRPSGLEGWRTPPECYLQRALAFAPRDHRVRLLYGIFLHNIGNYERAERMYRQALELNPDSAETHYNLGLTLLERGQYDQARRHAREAYAHGYPLPGLRRRLAAMGHPL